MAQPSVAREPSMEEILASIRRIIESNDPVNGASPSQDTSDFADEEGAGEVGPGYDGSEFVPANDAGPSFPMFEREIPRVQAETRRDTPQAPVEDMPKSVSLADLAARVRSASERMERPVQAQSRSETPAMPDSLRREPAAEARDMRGAESPLMAARLAEMRQPELRASQPAETVMPPVMRSPVEEPLPMFSAPATPMARIATVEVHLEQAEPVSPEPAMDMIEEEALNSSEPDMPARSEGAGRDLTALVSAATVEQVSRSFSDLAAAFDGSERRSLDEMAEEMLRPMLKDWLDDNLPTLVERLVREEIERVARGPRR